MVCTHAHPMHGPWRACDAPPPQQATSHMRPFVRVQVLCAVPAEPSSQHAPQCPHQAHTDPQTDEDRREHLQTYCEPSQRLAEALRARAAMGKGQGTSRLPQPSSASDALASASLPARRPHPTGRALDTARGVRILSLAASTVMPAAGHAPPKRRSLPLPWHAQMLMSSSSSPEPPGPSPAAPSPASTTASSSTSKMSVAFGGIRLLP